jgi:prepilin-type N-terminal cleavage/methylation domain-containing protein
MFKLMRKNRKGFTLIELIVVIAILAILAAIAIPTFTTITKDANQKVAVANARNIATAINTYNALNPNETQIATATGAQTTLTGANLWPSGLTDADATNAVKLIKFENSVAVVDSTIKIAE